MSVPSLILPTQDVPMEQVQRRGISPRAPVIAADLQIGGLMIGLPAYGGVLYDAVLHGMLDLQREVDRRGIPFGYVTVRNESLIQRARNRIVADFLAAPQYSHLLFIDADVGFTADAVLRLLAHDKPLVGGLYRRKTMDRIEWVWNQFPAGQERVCPDTGAITCAAIGTGFMMIRRDVVEKMVQASIVKPTLWERLCGHKQPRSPLRYLVGEGDPGAWRDQTFSLFDCWIDETGNYLSEDYAFCRRWRDLGGDVWADPGILLTHNGTATFAGDPMETLA